jgi:peptide/nickel transport system permease protein
MTMTLTPRQRLAGRWRRALDSDIWYSFRTSKVTIGAAVVTLLIFLGALLAPWIAPQNPFDPGSLDLLDAFTPPAWEEGGDPRFLLGTDNLGRDILSAILYGSRVSLGVGFAAVLFAMVLGVTLGLVSGYVGGTLDAAIMRVADVQISFPAILIVLLIDGIMRGILPPHQHDDLALLVIILALGISTWPQFARTVRGSTMVEKNKEYVQAARVIGRSRFTIMARHVLPNVIGPVLVIATISLAVAILGEATLSFLGVGVPATEPSLGTLIRIGNDFLFSGEWWIVIFPSATLAALVLAVNLLGDWLRDALNPKLR